MFQVELARPLALLMVLVLARWCAGAEPPDGLPVPPLPSPSAASSGLPSAPSPAIPPPVTVTAPAIADPPVVVTPPGPGPVGPDRGDEEESGLRPRFLRPPDAGFRSPAMPGPVTRFE